MTPDTSTREFVAVPLKIEDDCRRAAKMINNSQVAKLFVDAANCIAALSTVPAAPVAGEDALENETKDFCAELDIEITKDEIGIEARKTVEILLARDVEQMSVRRRIGAIVAAFARMKLATNPSPTLSRGQILEEAARAMCHLCDKGFGFHRSFPPHQVHEHNGEPFGRCPSAPIYSLLTQSPAALEGKATRDELLDADMDHETSIAAMIDAPTPASPRIDDAAVERAVQAAAEYADSLSQGSMDAPFIRSHRVGLVNAILQAFPPKER